MEIIVVITKEVENLIEAQQFGNMVKTFKKNTAVLQADDIKIEMQVHGIITPIG